MDSSCEANEIDKVSREGFHKCLHVFSAFNVNLFICNLCTRHKFPIQNFLATHKGTSLHDDQTYDREALIASTSASLQDGSSGLNGNIAVPSLGEEACKSVQNSHVGADLGQEFLVNWNTVKYSLRILRVLGWLHTDFGKSVRK